jgi:hypothetical protein
MVGHLNFGGKLGTRTLKPHQPLVFKTRSSSKPDTFLMAVGVGVEPTDPERAYALAPRLSPLIYLPFGRG